MKLVMTLLARDEADVIKENIEYHLAQGVDFIIATDHLSVDGTSDILRDYEKQGVLHYIREEGVFSQNMWVTRMARMAGQEHGADWIINNDADEFWWPLKGSLKKTFKNIYRWKNVLVAQRHNFVPVEGGESPFYKSMVWRQKNSLNPIGNPLPPKVAHRANDNVVVAHGNHSVSGMGWGGEVHGLVEVFHFPLRNYEQCVRKVEHIGEGYEQNHLTPELLNSAQTKIYNKHKENDRFMQDYYLQRVHGDDIKSQDEDSSVLIKDLRLARFFETIS